MEFIQFCKMFFSQTINWVFIVAFFATFLLYKYHFVKPLDARYKEIETYLDILKNTIRRISMFILSHYLRKWRIVIS